MLLPLLLSLPLLAALRVPRPPCQDGVATEAAREIGRLADRGRALRAEGRHDEAIETFETARAIAEEVADLDSVAVLESLIAKSYEAQGRHELQLAAYLRIRALLDGRDPELPFVAAVGVQVRHDIARVLMRLGRLEEAVDVAREGALRLDRVAVPELRATVLDTLGCALRASGRKAEAPGPLRRAAREVEDLDPGVNPRAEVLCDLAESLGELGDKEGALAIVDVTIRALESRAEVDPRVAGRAYGVRGVLHWFRSWPDAERDLRRAWEFLEAAQLPASSSDRVLGRLYLSFAVRNCGRPAESATMERELLETVLLPDYGAEHPLSLMGRVYLGSSLWDLAEQSGERAGLEEARRLYETTAALAREHELPNAPLVYGALGSLLLDGFDDPQAAEGWLREAVEGIEAASSLAMPLDEAERSALFRNRRFNQHDDPYEGLLRCLLRLERPEEALGVLELSRARGLADLLERSRFDAVAEALERAVEAGDEPAAERLRALPAEIDAALAESAAAERAAHEDPTASARRAEAQARLRALSSERAELTQFVTEVVRPIDVATLRRALEPGEALLGYFLGRKASFACLAEGLGGRVRWFELRGGDGRPLSAEQVASDTRTVLDAIAGPLAPSRGVAVEDSRDGSSELGDEASHALFERLVPPALWEAVRERALVYLLPHGELHRLPFEALVVSPGADASHTRYWLDEGPPLAYQESGSALVWSLARRAEQRRRPSLDLALIVAAPEYESPGSEPGASSSVNAALRIARVARGSPAARAGLQAGDVLLEYGGRELHGPEDLARLWREPAPESGTTPELRFLRAGGEQRRPIEGGDPGLDFGAGSEPVEATLTRSSPALPPLPGAAREAEAVRGALEARPGSARVRVLLGADATETLLSAWAPRAAILHIAAHQIPDPDGRWESGRLALTPPLVPTAEDDGFVDLDDLLLHWRRRLDRCELVVLASCRSRLGRLEADEGLYALPLGFRFAGAPAVVASLWPVEDAATAEWMADFYRKLVATPSGSRLEAFHAARRALRKQHPHPHAWAPFVWTGAPR